MQLVHGSRFGHDEGIVPTFLRLPGESDVERLKRLILVVSKKLDAGTSGGFGQQLLERLVGELQRRQSNQ